jgi:hypothetical protein
VADVEKLVNLAHLIRIAQPDIALLEQCLLTLLVCFLD